MADGVLLAVMHCALPHYFRPPACRNFPDNSLDSIANLHQLQSLELSGVGFTESASKPSVRHFVWKTPPVCVRPSLQQLLKRIPDPLGCMTPVTTFNGKS